MVKNNNICLGETLFPDCPVRNILARVGDKWSLLLMHQMMHHQEPMRFSDLKKGYSRHIPEGVDFDIKKS